MTEISMADMKVGLEPICRLVTMKSMIKIKQCALVKQPHGLSKKRKSSAVDAKMAMMIDKFQVVSFGGTFFAGGARKRQLC
mgnify:CR=1 FL=1